MSYQKHDMFRLFPSLVGASIKTAPIFLILYPWSCRSVRLSVNSADIFINITANQSGKEIRIIIEKISYRCLALFRVLDLSLLTLPSNHSFAVSLSVRGCCLGIGCNPAKVWNVKVPRSSRKWKRASISCFIHLKKVSLFDGTTANSSACDKK